MAMWPWKEIVQNFEDQVDSSNLHCRYSAAQPPNSTDQWKVTVTYKGAGYCAIAKKASFKQPQWEGA